MQNKSHSEILRVVKILHLYQKQFENQISESSNVHQALLTTPNEHCTVDLKMHKHLNFI